MPERRPIVLAGHICIDIVTELADLSGIRPGALIEVVSDCWSLGGTIANTGGTLTELGVPVRTVGAIADDTLGQSVRSKLNARGTPHTGLQITAAAGTAYSIVLQAARTDRTFLHYPGANAHFNPRTVDVADASIVHFGYPSLMEGMVQDSGEPIRALMQRAHEAGATTSIDLAVVDPDSRMASLDWKEIFAHTLPSVDVASPSLEDITSSLGIEEPFSVGLVERLARTFIDAGAGVVAVSAGAHGVFVATAGRGRLSRGGAALAQRAEQWCDIEFWQPSLPVSNWGSTNGAGDAFTAGLLFSLQSGLDPRTSARTAAACAAIRIRGDAVTANAVRGLLHSRPLAIAAAHQEGH